MTEISCRILTPNEYPRWDELAASSPDGGPYGSSRYLEILAEATGGSFTILAAEKGGELIGGMPLYQEPEFGLPVVTPRVLLYYSGLITRPSQSKYPSERTSRYLQVASAIEQELRRVPVALVRFKSRSTVSDVRPFVERGWRVTLAHSYVVPLGPSDAMLARIEQNLRRLINRAEKLGVTVAEDGDFDSFYRLHHDVHSRKGAKLYLPESVFRRYVERLRGAGIGRLYQARLPTGEVAASQLVLATSHPIAHVVSAASDGAHQNTGANPFLRWKVFEALAASGQRGCDLTDASLNDVTRFKSQFGGDLEVSYQLECPPSGQYRRRRAYAQAQRALKGGLRKVFRR